MPITYPPTPPTLVGDVETINRFLQSPTQVQRALNTLAQQRFIADVVFSGRVPASGGAVLYEQSESIYPDQLANQSINPGTEYPLTGVGTGPAAIAAVKKWGLDAIVTDESITRQRMNPVDRALIKLVNGVVRQVDTVAMAAAQAAITQNAAAGSTWNTSATLVREITAAVAAIHALNQGYDPDTLIVSDTVGGYLTANDKILSLLPRESRDMPIFNGYLSRILNLDILVTPNLPVATTAIVLDRKVFGSLGDETPLQSKSIREETLERWRLRAKRVTVPFVQEPNAGYRITGAG